MPPSAADADTPRLAPEQGADLVAHILKSNGFPAGTADFAAADATTSSIGWPAAPASEEPARTAAAYQPAGTLNQLMRGVFFPNANMIFTVQELEPKDLPPKPQSNRPGGLTIFEWGQEVYTGWPVVENAAVALADASTIMMLPGLRCENGRLAPNTEPDWIRFTDQMIAVAKRTYRLAQTQNKDAVSEFTTDLSNACNACHGVYRDIRGRGRGANAPGGTARCTHRKAADGASALRHIQRHDVRLLLRALDDRFAAVGRDVEVANLEGRREIGQLSLGAGLQIDEPQVLVLDLAAQEHERAAPGHEGDVPGAARERERRQRRATRRRS